MKRGLLVLLGVVLLLLGLALIGTGAAVAALVGSDDAVSTAPARLEGKGVALVAEDITVDESNIPVPTSVGTLSLTVSAPDGRAMFVGTAAPKDVDTYLAGAPYDVVVDMSSGTTGTTRVVPGTQQPPPPAGQNFWTAKASGSKATLSSRIAPTDSVVIMNADAAEQVDAEVVVTFTVKHAYTGSLIALGVGVVLVLLAVLSFWRARVAGRRKREAAAAALAAPAAGTVLPGVDAPSTDAEPAAVEPAAVEPVTVEPVAVEPVPPVEAAPTAPAPVAEAAAPTIAPVDPLAPAGFAAGAVVATVESSAEAPDATVEGAAGAPVAVDSAEPAADAVEVPAWAGSGGPDTLTGDELAAPPQGDAAGDGGFADDAARAAAVAGDTGPLEPVADPLAGAEEPVPDDAVADDVAAAGSATEPTTGAPDPETVAADDPGQATEPFERVDAPLYDQLNSWFRDEPSGGTPAGQ